MTDSSIAPSPGLLVADMFMTLDQVMQAPGEPGEDRKDGFAHGGWQVPYVDAENGASIIEQTLRMDALLLGRKTFDIFADYWPKAPADDPVAAHLNAIPKYVASRSDLTRSWTNATRIEDVPEAVAGLKTVHGEIHLVGSADLLQTLLAHDLVDVLNLWIYPLTLGTGKRVFGSGTIPAAFEPVAPPQVYDNGALFVRYRRAGAPTYGDFAWEARERDLPRAS